MEIELITRTKVSPAFIQVSAAVRYWEDGELNGVEDSTGMMPLRNGDNWEPIIRLKDGQIEDWPLGDTASIHYKVCDAGQYWLLDENKNRIAERDGYVPDLLCPHENGYGDYIIFEIDNSGKIVGWSEPDIDPDDWEAIS